MYEGSRAAAIDGMVNIRDLGGLRRSNGGLTPHGVFFRSENVDAVTALGWEQLLALGVRTVIDLRQPRERDQDRNPRPAWLTTLEVDLDGLEHEWFWKDYWDNGLVGTALYYAPHLQALPERAGAALAAIASAPAGGVLFHCQGGRDRTGMIAMLLLAAVETEPEEIVDDYLETVRLGAVRAGRTGCPDTEPEIEAFCETHGTTTEGAFRDALSGLDVDAFFDRAGLSAGERLAVTSWRGAIPPAGEG
jgi:protein-tyrosine phosphatase